MSWLSEKGENHCTDYDIFVYGLYCTPCLFGENAEHIQKHPSCISQTFAYSLLFFSSHFVGAGLGNLIVPNNPYVINAFAFLCSSIMIGHYGGQMRTKLRQKYNIDGNRTNDIITHCMCSPCAVCQEGQEIRLRNNNILDFDYHEIPQVQSMKS